MLLTLLLPVLLFLRRYCCFGCCYVCAVASVGSVISEALLLLLRYRCFVTSNVVVVATLLLLFLVSIQFCLCCCHSCLCCIFCIGLGIISLGLCFGFAMSLLCFLFACATFLLLRKNIGECQHKTQMTKQPHPEADQHSHWPSTNNK